MSDIYIATANRLLKANTYAQLCEVDGDILSLYMADELSDSEFSKLEDLTEDIVTRNRVTWSEEFTEHLKNLQG